MAAKASAVAADLFEELGVKPVINARSNQTLLGGAILSPEILDVMERANRYFVNMSELQRKAGQIVADLLECEAAHITPGCAAALALGAAACVAGGDAEKMARLPDTSGMKNRVVIQARHRYRYDHPPTIVGAKLKVVGGNAGTSRKELEAALDGDVAAVLFPAHSDGADGTVPLKQVIAIAHGRGVPVLLDAAAQIFPVERMLGWTKMGADLVCFGAKYFGAPHSAGVICGRAELVDSAARQSFIGFEASPTPVFGRPLKLDRGEIFAVVAALKTWLNMDHGARIATATRRIRSIAERVEGLKGVETSMVPDHRFGTPGLRVRLSAGAGKSIAELEAELEAGSPAIVATREDDSLVFNVNAMPEGDEAVVAERLRAALA